MEQPSNSKLGTHAIVIGGSIAGLVSARVLSDYFAKVTVIERDSRPEGPEPRKGSPQMRHAHVLLSSANDALRDFFPGIIDELQNGGAVLTDGAADLLIHHYGGWKPRFKSEIESVSCSRPFLEWHIRQRVAALPNVEILYEHVVEDLLTNVEQTRVKAVRVKGNGTDWPLDADLVVDAAGRGTRAPRWLEALGYGRPEEMEVGIDLAYTSRFYEIPKDTAVDWKCLAIYSRMPGQRGAFMFEVERGRWLVSLTGYFKDHCPIDADGFLAFAKSLAAPTVFETIKNAQPLTDPTTHKIPSSRWFRYDKMSRFPDGFVPIGDSVCALNPLYGQGMTVSIQCARELAKTLAQRAKNEKGLDGLSRVLCNKFANTVLLAWILSTTMDLRFPNATGRRPLGLGTLQWAFANFIDLSSRNERACRTFYDLLHMRQGPEALLDPRVLLPLISYSIKSPFVPFDQRINTDSMPKAP